jgi:chromosome segregation ATPase
MRLDELADAHEDFLNRARGILSAEITAAKKAVAALNAEAQSAKATLADLQEQCASVKKQVAAVRADLHQRSTLAGIHADIEKGHKTLEALKVEMAEAAKALEALNKQRADGERQLVALGREAQRLIAIRVEGEAVMAALRAKIQSVQIRQ